MKKTREHETARTEELKNIPQDNVSEMISCFHGVCVILTSKTVRLIITTRIEWYRASLSKLQYIIKYVAQYIKSVDYNWPLDCK